VTPSHLLGRVAQGLELEGAPKRQLALFEAIGGRLADRHRNARRPVLVVDEAQLASPSLLEEIRLLTNVEDRQNLVTQSLFVGAMRALHQIDAALVRDVADDQE